MKSTSQSKQSHATSQKKLSFGNTTQSTLSFGTAGKLGIKKVEQQISSVVTEEKTSLQFINKEAQKRNESETLDTVQVEKNETVESKAASKRLKKNDGSSEATPNTKTETKEKLNSAQKSTTENTMKMQIEDDPPVQNLPPKDLSKLNPPSSANYDPIKDAPFHKGEPLPFSFVSRALSEIETCKGKNSKDAIKEIMANLFRSTILLAPKELPDLFYFFCVKLGPEYEALETGIGLELLSNSVAKACGKSLKQIREQFKQDGDYGIVVEKGKGTQKSLGTFFKKQDDKPKPLTFRKVFEAFNKISRQSGNNSQSEKESIILKLLQEASNEEAKYIVRWLQKNLKTGAAEKTFISALARAIAYTPPNKKNIINSKKQMGESSFQEKCSQIEYGINEAICEFPDYGKIIETLLQVGDDMQKLKSICHIRVGIPVKPMLAKPTKGVREVLDRFEGIKFTCEYKYDGFRGQIHFDRFNQHQKVLIYSRNLENMTGQYPDVVEFIEKSAKEGVNNFILDSELVAYDQVANRILPFQNLTQRSRKNVTEEDLKTKICICAFDLLYLNGQSLLKETFTVRREALHKNLHEVSNSFMFAKYKNAEAIEQIEDFLQESIKDSCEGLMIKTLDQNATYEPSKRSLNWLKLKKDYIDSGLGDSLDLVVVGADFGKGKRTGMYGSFLLACYDENLECLQTVTKMATGLSDEMLAKIYNQLKDLEIDKPPSNLKYKEKNIDVWLLPRYVWEIKCADLSISPIYCAAIGEVESNKGIALRFPRFIREREDKKIEEATSSEQILDYYKSQPQLLNKEGGDDDDFDF